MTETPEPSRDPPNPFDEIISRISGGDGPRRALLNLFDDMADAEKQELLREAVRISKKKPPPTED